MKNKNNYFEAIVTIITICFTVAVGLLLSFIPNVKDVDFIQKNFVADISAFSPEKREVIQYIICTVAFPIFYFVIRSILTKYKSNMCSNKIYNTLILLSIIIPLALSCLVFTMEPFYVNLLKTPLDFKFIIYYIVLSALAFISLRNFSKQKIMAYLLLGKRQVLGCPNTSTLTPTRDVRVASVLL